MLKISIFTDDKRTDLIGEGWIDLKEIIIPGGGQNDVWQTLSCRGKYAGEIRLEITYYDTRPKPEKTAARSQQPAPVEQESGSMRQRSPMKRRPLPSDPVTGEAPSAPPPEHYQTPPRAHAKQPSQPGFIPNQSPLQAVEYNTPPSRRQADHYRVRDDSPRQMHSPRDPYETPPRHHEDREYSPRGPASPYDQDPRASHSSLPDPYEMPARDDSRQMHPVEDDLPPPPPAHRSRHNSAGVEAVQRNSLDTSPQKPAPMPMRHDVLRSEAHRQSLPTYPGRPTFRAFDSAPPAMTPAQSPSNMQYEQSALRHHSQDSTYDGHYRSMQPTVEDAPDSPTGRMGYSQQHSMPRNIPREDPGYEKVPSPAPLNLSRSPGASPYYGSPSPHTPAAYQEANGYSNSVSPSAARDYSDSHSQSSYHSHGSQNQHYGQRNDETHMQGSGSYGLPTLPASLIPGVDPSLSQEISERIYEERRQDRGYSAPPTAPAPRGRQRSEPPAAYGSAVGSSPGYAPQQHDRRSGMGYSGGSELSMVRHGNVSPNTNMGTHHTIHRKSVSPAPPPGEDRRASNVPFGPDSYNELNPALAPNGGTSAPGIDYIDPDAKIITHDGREVDPSDHLPMDSWAPEPEAKPLKASPDPRSRPSPAGAQPMPPSGRRPLRVARPQTMPAPPPSLSRPEERHTPPATSSTGRNRLQKKTHRTSVVPSPSESSPLAPISPDNYHNKPSPYTTPTRGPHRGNAWDYTNENHAPQHGYGPPIPAKVPIMSGGNSGSSDQMALMEEMQRIDIGAGRSRRRGGGY